MKAEIYITSKDVTALKRCFDAEINGMQTQRSTVAIHTTKDTMQFSVTAADATALRATLNSITKLLAVFEKVQQ